MTDQNNIAPEQLPQAIPVVASASATRGTERRKYSLFIQMALALALTAFVIVAWQWVNTRHQIKQLEKTLAQRLEQFNEKNQQTLALAKNADERSSDTVARTSLLEQRLEESRDQQEALQNLYLELANNREERAISEVEQLLVIANQQLQLAGNIKPALLALQTADTRLQQLDTPQVIQLRKVLAQDIQHLQSLPLIDIVGMSLKLESLTESIDSLPLVSDRHPDGNEAVLAPNWDSNPWRRLVQEIWQDLKGMIRLERIDRREPPLLAPDQTFFLRENIKLHLLTARIALLQHDETTYRADLTAAENWLKGHFDLREPETQNALHIIKELSDSAIVIQMPDISESLGLVSKYKLTLERVHGSEQGSGNSTTSDKKPTAKTGTKQTPAPSPAKNPAEQTPSGQTPSGKIQ
ncbi:MAG: uroporphyrinogen-III C-methyltransferase [Candidatus Methylopumilus sp.]|jgi:uroporphyrin-3 C-methyltransferase